MQEQGFKIFNLHRMNNGQFFVRLRVNGVIGKFILDTGATHNCISKNHRMIFKVKPNYESNASGIDGEVNANISVSNTISIGDIRFKDQTFVILNLKQVRESLLSSGDFMVNGIIGMNFLSSAGAVVDCDNGKLYLRND